MVSDLSASRFDSALTVQQQQQCLCVHCINKIMICKKYFIHTANASLSYSAAWSARTCIHLINSYVPKIPKSDSAHTTASTLIVERKGKRLQGLRPKLNQTQSMNNYNCKLKHFSNKIVSISSRIKPKLYIYILG